MRPLYAGFVACHHEYWLVMPEIYDNIQQLLLPSLQATLGLSYRADFCVGYFNLRGWKHLASAVESWPGGVDHQCRVLIGMQDAPRDELREALSLVSDGRGIDNGLAIRLKRRLASELRDQLTVGAPTDADEAALRQLVHQLKTQKVVVRLYLRHHLHAKLYLLHRHDPINPIIGYLGSSNLTFSGLKGQGELNIDVLDKDAAKKLSQWFEDRWTDRWCLDISKELIDIIEGSWAREALIPPYHVYLKMAYHLSQEARAGLAEYRLPKEFEGLLFDYQAAAVKIAARHLHRRGGVLIGDVVGLGKTLMATALARVFEDDFGLETLILCPKNLVSMWEDYRERFKLRGKVLSITRATKELPTLRRYRLVLIDESHNLRNREGKVYKAIHAYVMQNESRCILLTATPYNKTFVDLSNQLRLFVPEEKDLGIQPEHLLKKLNNHWVFEGSPRTLAAFEKSAEPDDWRELMRLYMVRRTRSFIIQNYAQSEPKTDRRFLVFADGSRSYFPTRVPKTAKFKIDSQFASLYSAPVVDAINALFLPRYFLGNYVFGSTTEQAPSTEERRILDNLGRGNNRLKGFCRTNLFKRLESSGKAFLLSVERHILRNYLFLYALQHQKPLPIGTQNADLLDTRTRDEDDDTGDVFELGEDDTTEETASAGLQTEADFEARAAAVYALYETKYKRRFQWIAPRFFAPSLKSQLLKDSQALLGVLHRCTTWEGGRDEKLLELRRLIASTHPTEKVLIFTQFADTARYLAEQLSAMGVQAIGCATGGTDATKLAQRFSPESNQKRKEIKPDQELRVLIATDVLSEGQNLQDARIIVNYDLPWAIIRLIQRAGRVDRIGQRAEEILCYSFLPAQGVEDIIGLRKRVTLRLKENAEVVGTDEAFFEDDVSEAVLLDLYHEKASLDVADEGEVDLASYAYQIWKNATDSDKSLKATVEELPGVIFGTKQASHNGVLVFLRTADGTDALAWLDNHGKSVTESQLAILNTAACTPNTPALPRRADHHTLVTQAVKQLQAAPPTLFGNLGRPTGARYRTYERLKRYSESLRGTLFDTVELERALDDIYRYPLTQGAIDALSAHLKGNISDDLLTTLVLNLRSEGRLSQIMEEAEAREPRILCSMGLIG